MKTVFIFFIMFLCSSCTNIEKPLIDVEKDKIIGETKAVVNAIYHAAEKCDPVKLTATYFDSPDFISLINCGCADYEQTVKKYPVLMSEYKS